MTRVGVHGGVAGEAEVAEAGVLPARAIASLDPLERRRRGLRYGVPGRAIEELTLHG